MDQTPWLECTDFEMSVWQPQLWGSPVYLPAHLWHHVNMSISVRVYVMKCPAPCEAGQMPTREPTDMDPVPSPEWLANVWLWCVSVGRIMWFPCAAVRSMGLRVSQTAFISTLQARLVSMATASGNSSSSWSGTLQSVTYVCQRQGQSVHRWVLKGSSLT